MNSVWIKNFFFSVFGFTKWLWLRKLRLRKLHKIEFIEIIKLVELFNPKYFITSFKKFDHFYDLLVSIAILIWNNQDFQQNYDT